MPDLTMKLNWNASTTIVSNIFIDKYMPRANPAYSVVYLLLLRHASANIKISPEETAEKLGLLESDVLKALKHWDKEGLLRLTDDCDEQGYSVIFVSPAEISAEAGTDTSDDEIIEKTSVKPSARTKEAPAAKNAANRKLAVVASRPQYTVEELEVYKKDCEEIDRLFKTAETSLAKLLSFNDLSVIFSLYDWLRLPVDVIELLLNYCADNGHRSVRYIEKVAIDWAENEINTVEKALARMEVFSGDYSEILKAFGHSRREPNQTEVAYMKKWLTEYKMPLDVIVAACDKTIIAIGQPKFAYADSILESWSVKGIKTLEAVNEAQEQYYKEKLEAASVSKKEKKTSKNAAPRANRFINFKQREWDYEQIEKLEREYIENSLITPAVSKG